MSDFQIYLKREENLKLAKQLKIAIWVLCAVVFILVGLMRSPEKIGGGDFAQYTSFLPLIHAVLNSVVTLLLILSLVFIKAKNIKLHKLSINVAMLVSILFLLCYVAYHFTSFETQFGDANGDGELSFAEKAAVGSSRTMYLIILASHIIFAGISLPFICYSWMYGMTNQFKKHKRMVKWVFPMWLYVAATGPVCYFLLKPYYQ